MKRLFILALAGVLFSGVSATPAVAGGDIVKVMTRNQYLGADLTPLILAQTPEDFFDAAEAALKQIAFNRFPLRARRLAAEVALSKPDLIGLQEVFDFTVNGVNIRPLFVNHLTETLAALAEKGHSYEVAAIVENVDIVINFDIDGDGIEEVLRVLDRDVILVREGVTWTNLSGLFTAGGLCGVQIPNPAFGLIGPEFLESTPSEDGCNYTIAAKASSPVGDITIERGFIGVDVKVRGKNYRFVDTHLEIMQPDPTDPNSAIIQSLQTVELVETLQALTPPDLPLILLGDFNSLPTDVPIGPIVPPYKIISSKGFADAWNTNPLKLLDPSGFTCCELADLSNVTSELDERIDIIFVRNALFLPLAFVTGRAPTLPLSLPPNWASDHGGVFAKLITR
jgi:endonuclease/exonuclease/phosphatase family metal-dependent hydrolase